VFFRRGDTIVAPEDLEPETAASIAGVPADGKAHVDLGFDLVAVPLGGRDVLVLRHPRSLDYLNQHTVVVLAALLLLAILIGWITVRGLVGPLQSLALHLPAIESTEPIDVPEAKRPDEIGEVARSFLRTRQVLHEEREQRARMEKLAVLGRMTASFAHEVQNPVAAIKLHAQLLRGTEAAETAATIEDEITRIEELVQSWMFLSRPEPPALGDWSLRELIGRVVESQRRQLEHACVTVDVDCRDDLRIACDGKRIRHVFSNLLDNAAHAMPGGGMVRIEAREHDGRVTVAVIDSGSGFSSEALARFAEFFFSEKEGGMGIGLGVAREIVAAHGGTLRAGNAADGGAEVTVWLPRRPPSSTAADEHQS
ncbi:MAG: HAMP domain-containing histidine kinase, partial [Planctomycetes bacterium]|nr:HAMP domain-containing histidine kinase [Planctomycetota bacterium]